MPYFIILYDRPIRSKTIVDFDLIAQLRRNFQPIQPVNEKTLPPYKLDAIAALLIDMDNPAPVLLVIRPWIEINPRIVHEVQRRYPASVTFTPSP